MGSAKGNCISMADLNWRKKELLGKGKFGCLYRTLWYTCDMEGNKKGFPVAVKNPYKNKKKIFAERNLKSKLSHENIVNIWGFAQLSHNHKTVLVFEYTDGGTMHDFVWEKREKGGATAGMMTRIAFEIAKGMKYLHDNSYAHGDLALRNCIKAANGRVKVGDFGFYEDRYSSCYFTDEHMNGSLPCPVRWMAPEHLPFSNLNGLEMYRKPHKKSYKGDVWAFGVVLLELWTLGERPFQGLVDDQTVCKHVLDGETAVLWKSCFRMDTFVEELMKRCWKSNWNDRPSSSSIVHKLEDLILMMDYDRDDYEISDKYEVFHENDDYLDYYFD